MLDPVLFRLFINDLFEAVRLCKVVGYADDKKLFHTIRFIEDGMNMQLYLVAIFNWSVRNRLPLNVDKCSHHTFAKQDFLTPNVQ